MAYRYVDRVEAGKVLGRFLKKREFKGNPVVVALPRGGVPVAFEVAEAIGAPLDVLVVLKIGSPGHSELACGAVLLTGEVVWNERILKALDITKESLRSIVNDEIKEAKARESALRSPQTPAIPLRDVSVIIVDDGLATGATMKAAICGVFAQKPKEVMVAIPVAPTSSCVELEMMGCTVICVQRIDEDIFSSVGQWYQDFPQISTAQCRQLLTRSRMKDEGAVQDGRA
jgi:putative phosphoribosyl transferase